MEHSHREIILVNAPLGKRVHVTGTISGRVIGILVDPNNHSIVQTILTERNARQIHQVEVMADAQAMALNSGTVMTINGKNMGKLSRVLVDDSVITDMLFTYRAIEYRLSVAKLSPSNLQFSAQAIQISMTRDEVKRIPVFRDDMTLEKEVNHMLNTVILNPRIRHDIHVRVEDGIAEVSGIVDAREVQDAILDAARRVPGIRNVRSDILITESLADQVTHAIDALIEKGSLGDNPEITVLSEHQIIYLYGTVTTSKAAQDAEQAAIGINGVRIVVNNLRVLQPTEQERADPASPKTHNK